ELRETRPSLVSSEGARNFAHLEPLGDDQSLRLIENLIGEAGLARELGARITGAAQGNPLFVEEMLRMLVDDGRLRRDNGGWAVEGDVQEIGVPSTIE